MEAQPCEEPPWSPQQCACAPVWQEVRPWAPVVVQGPHPHPHMYYVTYPAPFYVTVHGGVMVERPPVFRPRPVYPSRKRCLVAGSAEPPGGVRRALLPPQPNGAPGEEETPKRNRVELAANVNRPTDPYRRAVLGTLTKEKKHTCRLSNQDQKTGSSSPQPASTVKTSDTSYADVLKSHEPSALINSESEVTVKTYINTDKVDETVEKGESSENVISFNLVSDKPQDKLYDQVREGFIKPVEPRSLDSNTLDSIQKKQIDMNLENNVLNFPKKNNLEIASEDMYTALKRYVPTKDQLKHLGYPMLFSGNPKIALIYKQAIRTYVNYKNKNQNKKKIFESNEKICCRCGRNFYVKGVTYLTLESCRYHWGKIKTSENFKLTRACCNGDVDSEGCTLGKLHVWSGISDGLNQLKGFVKSPQGAVNYCILGLDCEMIYTKAGMEVASVVLVNIFGDVVYQALVRPQHEVIDYNTRFSGISLDDYINENHPKPFHDVQKELLKFIKSGTIVVGHSLENDLRVLKLVHPLVVDTAVMYPHQDGFPYRRKLKDIAREVLQVQIQKEEFSHDPVEDAKAALALALRKVNLDWEASKPK